MSTSRRPHSAEPKPLTAGRHTQPAVKFSDDLAWLTPDDRTEWDDPVPLDKLLKF